MFAADNVIHLVWRVRVLFMQQAVLTAMSGPLSHQPPNRIADVHVFWCVCWRARALAMIMMCAS